MVHIDYIQVCKDPRVIGAHGFNLRRIAYCFLLETKGIYYTGAMWEMTFLYSLIRARKIIRA